MQRRVLLVTGIGVVVLSHYVHYEINRIRNPFYNTVCSVPDLPMKFYQVNRGDHRMTVEHLIGRPLFHKDSYEYYSLCGTEGFMTNLCTIFQIRYQNDTVAEKRVIRED
jgi:hypothetical protein